MISVTNLKYRYPEAADNTLRGIDFEIASGEIFGFLGPSGSGKTTTQKIICKLLSNYDGSVQLDGDEVEVIGNDIYNRIGIGFELPNHYLKLTALENLRFFQGFFDRTRDPEELLEQVGLLNDAHKRVADFSKGMKVRLNFVRALLHDPEILFFDEPTSGLDPVNARTMKNLILEEKRRGKTIFLTTHQMYDAEELCDRVAFIVDGEIMATDSPENLKLEHSRKTVEVKLHNSEEKRSFPIEDLGSNGDFLEFISDAQIDTIHSQEASLDEVFIEVTGRTLT